jgi:putative FmdB family regulatory protein
MPIYEYVAVSACQAPVPCSGKLDLFAKFDDPESTVCPTCGAAIQRVMSAPAMAVSGAHRLKEKHFSERGFTQYKKAGGGVYEKTAGDGPQFISGNDS